MSNDSHTYTRANVPSWLADPDGVAPCMCGRPLKPGEIPVIAAGELGMRRWFHIPCWNLMSGWDDEEEDDDE